MDQNPFASPGAASDAVTEASKDASWRRPSLWIGLAEILIGIALSFKGCAYGVDLPPAPLVAMLLGFVIPNIAVTVPGVALVRYAPFRWGLQVIPVLFIGWVLIAFVFG